MKKYKRQEGKREAEIEVRTTGSPGKRQYEKLKSLQFLELISLMHHYIIKLIWWMLDILPRFFTSL